MSSTIQRQDIAKSLGVEFHRGILQARVQTREEPVQAVKRVAEVARRLSEGIGTSW